MTIVIVDDSVTNLIVLRSLSASACNSTAIGFSDTDTATAYLERNTADLIVLDYSMPKMNGVQLTTLIRDMAHHRTTPIVMVTHSTDHQTRMCALQAGATAFLNKPVAAAEFKSTVANLLNCKPANAVIGAPSAI